MKTWDDMQKIYPYSDRLPQYQHVSYVHSKIGNVIRENSNQGIQTANWKDTDLLILNVTVDFAYKITKQGSNKVFLNTARNVPII